MIDVSLYRLISLRALYLLVIIGLGITVWPGVIHHEQPWELKEGVVQCMLAAFSALSVLGLRYPLKLLPLLLWEMLWKSIWLIVVALPLWSAGQMDESTWATVSSCLLVLIFPFGIPWRYVFVHYLKIHGDRFH